MRFDQLQLDFDLPRTTAPDRHRVVIAYDSPSDRRRRRLARTTEGYATRVQKSVYEAELTEAQLRVLSRALRSLACEAEDDIRLYPQCVRCAALCQFLGRAAPSVRPMLVVA